MSIQDDFNKIKPKSEENGLKREFPDKETVSFDENGEIVSNSSFRKYFVILIILLISVLSFGLGRLSTEDSKRGVTIKLDDTYSTSTASYEYKKVNITEGPIKTIPEAGATVVGSIKGTKYHYLYCPGAKQISEANKITFKNAAAAESAGYTLALNCKPR